MAVPLPRVQKVALLIPDGSGGTDGIVIDACVTEQHVLANTLTDNPVEEGANVVDHSRPEPRRVTLDCVQSNTPTSVTRIDEKGNVTGESAGADGTDRALALWQRFVALHENPKVIGVRTVRDFYRSMGVETVTAPVDAKTANALKFTVTLKEVRVVQNKFTRVTRTSGPSGQQRRDLGKASTKEADAQSKETLEDDITKLQKIGSKLLGIGGG